MAIPDARKGERAADIQEGVESWGSGPILLLNSIPDHNIYLYGYYDPEEPGCGLILDVGKEQHIYAFPYRYMTNTMLRPDINTNSDGSLIYVSCHTGNGTGVSVSELYVFQVGSSQIEPYYVDVNALADRLGGSIAVSYDAEGKKATVLADHKEILTDTLTSIGAGNGESIAPDSYYCGNQISYLLDGDSVRVSFAPTFTSQAQPGVQFYLAGPASLGAEIRFRRDGNGIISDFELGKVESMTG